jgi:hypothetical protein
MTYFAVDPTQNEVSRELRTTVRLPGHAASRLFQGWGPKF